MATTEAAELPSPTPSPLAEDVPAVSTSEETILIPPPETDTTTTQPQEAKAPDAPIVSSSSPFFDSFAELKGLSAAIASFQECYEDLRSHLESIKAAIAAQLPSGALEQAPRDAIATTPSGGQQPEHSHSELEGLCRTMAGRALRKYLINHLSNLSMLRIEVPKALKLSPNPPKLVLECFGKFFLQGSAAFSKNHGMAQIHAREASIFILECFLLMMGMNNGGENSSSVLNIDNEVKGEAESSAMAWRKRLIAEGGLHKASQIDARGLLMLVACFGIPVLFKEEDIRDLVNVTNSKETMDLLRNSGTLMSRISEIVDGMIKHKMEVDAVDIIYALGLEGKYDPRNILLSFLREAKESGKRQKKMGSGSASSVIECKKQQLSNLKSITKCLEKYNVDVTKLLAGWQIKEKIAVLERDLSETGKKFDKKPSSHHKRKANEADISSRRRSNQEAKRSRFSIHHPPSSTLFDSPGHPHLSRASSYSGSPSIIYGGPGAEAGLLIDPSNFAAHPRAFGNSAIVEMQPGNDHLGLPGLYRTSREGYARETLIGSRGLASEMRVFVDPERFPGAGSPSIASISSSKRSSFLHN